MKILKQIICTFIVLININAYAGTEIFCNVRYLSVVYHEPSYYEGGTIGRVPIAGSEYSEKVWSNTYKINVKFFSGYELNEHFNNDSFNDNAIVALVNWENGGYTYIIIKGWRTNLKYMTEDEIKYNTEGERITYMTGYDNEERNWEFYY